jgi:hypothetical protein
MVYCDLQLPQMTLDRSIPTAADASTKSSFFQLHLTFHSHGHAHLEDHPSIPPVGYPSSRAESVDREINVPRFFESRRVTNFRFVEPESVLPILVRLEGESRMNQGTRAMELAPAVSHALNMHVA